jgi:hypothetical protein
VSHSLLQQSDNVGHRKDHLDVGVLFGGESAELLHGSLLFDLISFLHIDSLLVLGRTINRRPIMAATLRIATFYGLTGNLHTDFPVAGMPDDCQHGKVSLCDLPYYFY